jgi:hypothetical protein
MHGDLAAALAAVESGGHRRLAQTLGVEFALQDPDEAIAWLEVARLHLVAFAGTRTVNDYLPEHVKTEENRDAILALELALCERDPYRRVAPFLQLIGRR